MCLGVPSGDAPAHADTYGNTVQHQTVQDQVDEVATEIERVADLIMVDGVTSETSIRSRLGQNDALAYYFGTLRTEQQSMEEYGGVTVLDTTANIKVLPAVTTSTTQITGELHVTRTVAELPQGERWEEILPVTLDVGSDGALSVTSVGVQDLEIAEVELESISSSQSLASGHVPAVYSPDA